MGSSGGGWGTMWRPTGQGARRVQMYLSREDVKALHAMKNSSGAGSLAGVLRDAVRAQDRLEAAGHGTKRRLLLGALALGAAKLPGGGVRFSHWAYPEELEALGRIRRKRSLASLGGALRYSIRAQSELTGVR
jgi:hypothetical protein